MTRDPMPRDVDAPAYPDAVVPLDVIEEAAQPGEAAGPSQQPAMHADREHLRALLALGVQDIERVAQIGEELVAGVEALRQWRTACRWCRARTGTTRCGCATPSAVVTVGPERQVVAVVIGIVQKAAVLDDEAPRVRAVAAGVPADRCRAGDPAPRRRRRIACARARWPRRRSGSGSSASHGRRFRARARRTRRSPPDCARAPSPTPNTVSGSRRRSNSRRSRQTPAREPYS